MVGKLTQSSRAASRSLSNFSSFCFAFRALLVSRISKESYSRAKPPSINRRGNFGTLKNRSAINKNKITMYKCIILDSRIDQNIHLQILTKRLPWGRRRNVQERCCRSMPTAHDAAATFESRRDCYVGWGLGAIVSPNLPLSVNGFGSSVGDLVRDRD